MSKQLFDEVVGEMPPSTVDTFAIVRQEKRRRAIRVTSLATAVVALALTAGLTMTGTGAPARRSAVPPRPSQAAGDRFALVAYDDQAAATSAQQLRKVLDDAFHKEAPGARWVFERQFIKTAPQDGQPPNLFSKDPQSVKGGQPFFGIGAILNDGRRGYLQLVVRSTSGKITESSLLTCHANMPQCTEGTSPDGAKTLLWTDSSSSPAVTNYFVSVGLPDGWVLSMSTGNAWGGVPAAQRDTPLTRQQLLAIATDIASHIKA